MDVTDKGKNFNIFIRIRLRRHVHTIQSSYCEFVMPT